MWGRGFKPLFTLEIAYPLSSFYLSSMALFVKSLRYIFGKPMYRCYKCGKVVPGEKPLDGSSLMCSCGSRVFMKVRPQRVKRVRAI